MAKYYITSGDLSTVISTQDPPKLACKRAIQEFMEEYKDSKDKSIATSILISERGFRSEKVSIKNDDVLKFDVITILDLIP